MKKYLIYVSVAMLFSFITIFSANAITYEFTKVAESIDDDAESLRGSPSINNSGTVVYYDHYTLYTYDGSINQFYTAIRSPYSSISFYPSINNSGTVAFGQCSVNGLWAIVASDGETIEPIFNNINYEYSSIASNGEINSNGYVSGWAKIGLNTHLIYLSDGTDIQTLADTSGIYHTLLIGTAINNNNFVAFRGYFTGGSEVVVSNGQTSEIIANTDSLFDHFNLGDIDINDSKQVAFRAALDDGGEAVVLGETGNIEIMARTDSRFESFNNGGFDGVSVNNLSEVVFWAQVDGSGGIYVTNEYCLVKVIGVGSNLNGDIVTDLFISNEAINDNGQIVFRATLKKQDDSLYKAIYIADPSGELDGTDTDEDGIIDCMDNCPETDNNLQEDMDSDGIGDTCDKDVDGDGFDSVLSGGQDSNDLDATMTPDTECGPDGTDPEYDGNEDGTPDGHQEYVQSMYTFDDSGYVTISSPDGTILNNVCAEDNPAPDDEDCPSESDFPYGFFSFAINNIAPGGNSTVTINLPDGSNPETYYKYGPTPLNSTPHWYEFMYDTETGTGAQITGNTITLHFVDGLRGDDDLDATNGIIVDIGAPGVNATSTPENQGSGGGGCFISILEYFLHHHTSL